MSGRVLAVEFALTDRPLANMWQSSMDCLEGEFGVTALGENQATLVRSGPEDWYVDVAIIGGHPSLDEFSAQGLGITANFSVRDRDYELACALHLFPDDTAGTVVAYGATLEIGSNLYRQLYPTDDIVRAVDGPRRALLRLSTALAAALGARAFAIDNNDEGRLVALDAQVLRERTRLQPVLVMAPDPDEIPDFPYVVGFVPDAMSRAEIIGAGWDDAAIQESVHGYVLLDLL